MIMSIQTSVIQ